MSKKIGFLVSAFHQWGGGASILHLMTEALKNVSSIDPQAEPYLIFIDENFSQVEPSGFALVPTEIFFEEGILGSFLKRSSFTDIYISASLKIAIDTLYLDLIAPVHIDLGSNFSIPWCGYIYDLQHKRLPENFQSEDINKRDILFRGILKNASKVFVNSKSVIDDIKFYYADIDCGNKLSLLPKFIPKLDPSFLLKENYWTKNNFEGRYFISCSQQWKHKQHDVIIRAFAKIPKEFLEDISLVFTGAQVDSRFPEHGKEIRHLINELGLSDRVHYLGFITREEQLSLINESVSLIQASLFEGGSGASGTLEAAILGVPIIASDIAPNRELSIGNSSFFEPQDIDALSKHMLNGILSHSPINALNEEQRLMNNLGESKKFKAELLKILQT